MKEELFPMKIKDIRKLIPILKYGAKAVYLDEGTEVSFVDDASSLLLTVTKSRSTHKVPGLISTAVQGFTRRQEVIIRLPLKKNNILIITRHTNTRSVDFVLQCSDKKIGNPNPFMFPQDLSFFANKSEDQEEQSGNDEGEK